MKKLIFISVLLLFSSCDFLSKNSENTNAGADINGGVVKSNTVVPSQDEIGEIKKNEDNKNQENNEKKIQDEEENNNDKIVNKVFKLNSYFHNDIFDSYNLMGYGSAVLIDNNKVITNAHVVLDDNGEPLGNYELCKTEDLSLEPECFSLMVLDYYNQEDDLAILNFQEDPDLGEGITLTKKKFTIGDDVNVYGYPANGGGTITYTQGKISGISKGLYKIDANIDAGNSGGGAFDDENELIGIPTFVSMGFSTLGYIVPVDKINYFLEKKGKTQKYFKGKNIVFEDYLDKKHNILETQTKISNDFFALGYLDKLGYKVEFVNFNKFQDMYVYRLGSEIESLKVVILLSKGFVDIDNKELKKDFEETFKDQCDNYQFNITKIQNKDFFAAKCKGNEQGEDFGSIMYLTKLNDNYLFNYMIIGDLSYTQEVKNATNLLKKGFRAKKINARQQFEELNYGNMIFKKIKDLVVATNVNIYGDIEISVSLYGDKVINADIYTDEYIYDESWQEYNFLEFLDNVISEMQGIEGSKIDIKEKGVFENNFGQKYGYIKGSDGENQYIYYLYLSQHDQETLGTYLMVFYLDEDNKLEQEKIRNIGDSIEIKNSIMPFSSIGGDVDKKYRQF